MDSKIQIYPPINKIEFIFFHWLYTIKIIQFEKMLGMILEAQCEKSVMPLLYFLLAV